MGRNLKEIMFIKLVPIFLQDLDPVQDQDLALNSIGIRLRSRIFDIDTDPIQVGDPASLHIFFLSKSELNF